MGRWSIACLWVFIACGPAAAPVAPSPSKGPATAPPASDPVATWSARLGDPRVAAEAVEQLEGLGDPRAIPALGKAWTEQGRPPRLLKAIIHLAQRSRWTEALPVLRRAIAEPDEANPRSVDSAFLAADEIGKARLADAAPELIELAQRPPTMRLVTAQVAATRALGRLSNASARAAAGLLPLVEREPPPHPRGATPEDRAERSERFELALMTTGAAINALAELRAEAAIPALVLALYRVPELNSQLRRALVAAGPGAVEELRKVIRGAHAGVEELVRTKQLNQYCGERGDEPCQPLAASDLYAAHALGAFHDPSVVPDLLAILRRPELPGYYDDGVPGPAQHTAVFDALRRIGSPDAAAPLRALWADRKQPVDTRAGAIEVYPFVAPDDATADELGKIAADKAADDTLRQAAAAAYALLSRSPRAIAVMQQLAKQSLEAADRYRREAKREQPRAEAADRELAKWAQAVDRAKAELLRLSKDATISAAQIRAQVAVVKSAERDAKAAKTKHREQVAKYKMFDMAEGAHVKLARTFETHIARVELAMRCRDDLACLLEPLQLSPDDAASKIAAHVPDVSAWPIEDKRRLVAAAVERGVLELGKRGAAAGGMAGPLLARVSDDDRVVRQSILLALPRLAPRPCAVCVEKLDAAIRAEEAEAKGSDRVIELTLLRNYFVWAGVK